MVEQIDIFSSSSLSRSDRKKFSSIFLPFFNLFEIKQAINIHAKLSHKKLILRKLHAVCFSVVFRATATLNRKREKLFINSCALAINLFFIRTFIFELRVREINYWPAIRIYRRGKEMSAIIGCFCSCLTKQVAHTVRITNSPHLENMKSGVK